MELTIDVWCAENRDGEMCLSIADGKSTMRKFLKEGKTEIRMYADYSENKRFYYSFKNGKIVKEDNSFNN